MKLQKVEFNEHKILKNLSIDFCDKSGKPLNTVVIIGENGSGKTTLLKSIVETFLGIKNLSKSNDGIIKFRRFGTSISVEVDHYELKVLTHNENLKDIDASNNHGKIIYMPTEINFDKLNKVDNAFKLNPQLINVIDQNMTENIPSLIASKINKEIFANRNKVIGEVIDEVCKEINSIFEGMDLDVKLYGLSATYDAKPIFKNSFGEEFDITGLSSGEKQLFLRALSLKFLEVNNSIILIDEPEISLHPTWQQKIINVYENIGENNQLIIATHSPHIIGDIKAEQLRVMKKDAKGISVVEIDELNETYGQTVEGILKSTMKVKQVRNEDISEKLDKIYNLLNKNEVCSQEYKDTFEYLRKYLGDLDKDIMRIKLEEARQRKKTNAEGK